MNRSGGTAQLACVGGWRVMPEYRVYFLDSSGHITGPPTLIDCPDDDKAETQARELLDDKTLEIWHRDRRVAVVSPPKNRR